MFTAKKEDKDWHNLQSARMDYVRELAREKNTLKECKYSAGDELNHAPVV